jgi:hypothetical protein
VKPQENPPRRKADWCALVLSGKAHRNGRPKMRDLLNRIWRYLNYPPNTHGKVEEIRQGMKNLSDYFPPRAQNAWKVDAAIENFRKQIAAVENDLRYLKTLVTGLTAQLTDIQDHLRSSQPWLPSLGGPDQKPEDLLLTFLANSVPNPAEFPVLKTALADLGSAIISAKEQLAFQIVAAVYSVGKDRPADENALGKGTIRDMQMLGYQWILLIFSLEGVAAVRFAANLVMVPDLSSGSLFFFKDYHLFGLAYRWSQAALPRFQHRDENQPQMNADARG